MEAGDVIYDHWAEKIGLVLRTYTQQASLEYPHALLMGEVLHADGDIQLVEDGDSEVLFEGR